MTITDEEKAKVDRFRQKIAEIDLDPAAENPVEQYFTQVQSLLDLEN